MPYTAAGRATQRALAPFTNRDYRKTPDARARLAAWATALGRPLEQIPGVWHELVRHLPTETRSDNGEPSPAENATVTALAVYATVQRSRTTGAHEQNDTSFGTALRALADTSRRSDRTSPLDDRVRALVTAPTWTAVSSSIRHLALQMRTTEPTFDLTRFADDLTRLQDPTKRPGVLLNWSRDYYHQTN